MFVFLLWPRAGFQRGFSFPGGVFFLLWPRAGFQRGFSFPCLSPGPQQKKKHPGWCFFFCCGPARTLTHSLRAWVAMPPPRRGGVFFFAAAPPGPGWCFFFCCGPARTLTHSRWAGAISARPGWCFFFLLRPRRVFLDNSKKSRGRSKKKTPWVVFFFCSGPVPASNGASPSLAFRRGRSKKKTPWVVFFFAAAPRGRSLTHCGPGWRCLPLAGAVFFFFLRPRPDRGGVFFLLWPRPDAHSLTVGWGDFGKARVVFFSLLRPRRVFLDNSKKSRGRSQKKNTLGGVFFFCSGPVPASNGASPSLAFRRGRSKKNTLGGVFFFLLWPRAGFQRGFSFPCLSPGPQPKKKHPGWFFFLLRPRADAHSLTASLGGDASPSPGRCFFFCCGPARTGVVFFFCCGPARTLTHSRWAGAISARPGWCFFFFAAAPPGLFRE